MVELIQILFVASIVAMAIANVIGVLNNPGSLVAHRAPRTRRDGVSPSGDPGETARRTVIGDPLDMELYQSESNIDGFGDPDSEADALIWEPVSASAMAFLL